MFLADNFKILNISKISNISNISNIFQIMKGMVLANNFKISKILNISKISNISKSQISQIYLKYQIQLYFTYIWANLTRHKLLEKFMFRIHNFQKGYSKMKQDQIKYQSTMNKNKKELQDLKDPAKIEEAQKSLFKNFVNSLISFNAYNPIPKKNGVKYVAIIGENCSGKTSLYNWLFNLNLQVGFDDTTQQIHKVFADETIKIVYFDSPGINENVSITNAQYLKAFYQIDYVFIVTSTTFKMSKKSIEVMNKINPPKLVLVRAQCDKAKTETQFQMAVIKDKALLTEWGIKRQILYVSCMKPDNFKDNLRFKNLMKSK